MTTVRVLSAYPLGEATVASVELDGLVVVSGVTLDASLYSGRLVARPPRRPYGDHRPIIAWSEQVAAEVAAAVLEAVPAAETVAVIGADAPEPAEDDVCPLCGGAWTRCGCDPDEALAAYEAGEAA